MHPKFCTCRYSILRPEFIMQKHEKPGGSMEYSCKLQLPCNAPFEKLEGPICGSIRLAQQVMMVSLEYKYFVVVKGIYLIRTSLKMI